VDFILQGDEIFGKASSLKGYYQAQKPYLETTTRNIWESFDTKFNKRYTPLSIKLKYAAEELLKLEQNIMKTAHKRSNLALFLSPTIVVATSFVPEALREILFPAKQRSRFRDQLQPLMEEILNAARFAREWNPQTHVDAFDAEAARLSGHQRR
jgi:hypothetical protein